MAEATGKVNVKRLRELLFDDEDQSTYVILDGASVPGLLKKLFVAKEEWVSLYRGELEPDLAQVAPYLVKLREQSELTDWILEEGWGKHWGIFVITQTGLEALRRHFRKFLRVKDSEGKVLYFRYYDPRVLNVYLPTCNSVEIQTVYGPVKSYIAEDAKTGDAILFPCDARRVTPKVISLHG